MAEARSPGRSHCPAAKGGPREEHRKEYQGGRRENAPKMVGKPAHCRADGQWLRPGRHAPLAQADQMD